MADACNATTYSDCRYDTRINLSLRTDIPKSKGSPSKALT